MSLTQRCVFALAGLLLHTSASAFNNLWLEYSPIQFFTEEDWTLLKSTVNKALEQTEKGTSLSWANEESGNSGTVIMQGTAKRGDTLCRRLQINNETAKLSGSSTMTFCQQPDGEWKIDAR